MDRAQTVVAQVMLPARLYKIIEKRAQDRGHSINSEIVALISCSLPQSLDELEQEWAEWEAASDEDWQAMETALAAEAS